MTTENVTITSLEKFVDRIERLAEEKDALQEDIKNVYAELESQGFDKKVVRTLIRRRKKDREELEQEDGLLNTYEAALNGNS
jgi:uncharacterized protein (UPF0335 family)